MIITCQNHPSQPLELICTDHDCPQLGPFCKKCIHSPSHHINVLDDYIKEAYSSVRLGKVIPSTAQIKQQQQSVYRVLESFFNKMVKKYAEVQSTLHKDFKKIQADSLIHQNLEAQRQRLITNIAEGKVDNNSQFNHDLQEIIIIQHGLMQVKEKYTNHSNLQYSIQKRLIMVQEKFDLILAPQKQNENVDDSIIGSSSVNSFLPKDNLFCSAQVSMYNPRSMDSISSKHGKDHTFSELFPTTYKEQQNEFNQILSNNPNVLCGSSEISKWSPESKLSQGAVQLRDRVKLTQLPPKDLENSVMIESGTQAFYFKKPEVVDKDRIFSQSAIIKKERVVQVKLTHLSPNMVPLIHQKMNTIKNDHKAIKFMFLIKGDRIVTAGHEPSIKIWKRSNLVLLQILQAHQANIVCLTHCEENQILASVCRYNQIMLWQFKENTLENYMNLVGGHNDKVRCLKIYDSFLASGGDDEIITIWSLKTGQIVRRLTEINKGRISCLESTNQHLIVGCYKTIFLFNIINYLEPKAIQAHESLVISLLITQSNEQLIQPMRLVASQSQYESSKKVAQNLQKKKSILLGKPYEGRIIISGGGDLKVKLWNYQTLDLLYTMNEEYTPVSILHIKKLNFLVVGLRGYKQEGKIMIWNINNQEHAQLQGEICSGSGGVNTTVLFEDQQGGVCLCVAYDSKIMETYKLNI